MNIEIAAQSVFETVAGQVQNFLLDLDVLTRDGEALLVAARADVIPRDFRQQRDQHVALAVFRSANFSIGGFHRPPGAAENVEFPGGIETGVVKIVIQSRAGRQRRKTVLP